MQTLSTEVLLPGYAHSALAYCDSIHIWNVIIGSEKAILALWKQSAMCCAYMLQLVCGSVAINQLCMMV